MCIVVAPGYGTTFDLPHYREQRAYFAPGVQTAITESRQVNGEEVLLVPGPCEPNVARPTRSLVACEAGAASPARRSYRGRLAVYY